MEKKKIVAIGVIQYLNQSCFSKLHSLVSTNGLVCLWNFYGDVAVLNPFTREHIFLPNCQQPLIGCCSLGFDPTTKKYKVIKAHWILGGRNSCEVRYWIYTIGVDKIWREIPDCANIFPIYNFVYIGGVIYCVNRLSKPYNIAAFSVEEEKLIRMILLPDGILAKNSKIVEMKGQVALLDLKNIRGDGYVSLHVLNGTGKTKTWVKHIIALPL
ncbi:putative F-box protein At1g32420 [Nicotiana tabacum]|uniref:F-box protein At1g32420 n=1 Tax=Nicotiana tabacum TaxID=4097 RepID=A0A1S4C4T7_TOBAC|nr:putative F-box protein At1g32420 [Nicotiana tomentosiformis]XP_016496181.1 PREDICTED: putative F-box protein At1g32420 [Nicotiana tabacum]